MTVLLTLATADLDHAKVVICEIGYLFRQLNQFLLGLTRYTRLLPSIVSPGEETTVLCDAHCIVHAQVHLPNRCAIIYLCHQSGHVHIRRLSAQLTAAKGVQIPLGVYYERYTETCMNARYDDILRQINLTKLVCRAALSCKFTILGITCGKNTACRVKRQCMPISRSNHRDIR